MKHKMDCKYITHRNGRIFLIPWTIEVVSGQVLRLKEEILEGPYYPSDRDLIGIMVASTTTDPRLRTEYDRESIEEEIIDASSNPADTWITPGALIDEAYQMYLVKHGLLQVRRDKERGESKAKRRAIDTS